METVPTYDAKSETRQELSDKAEKTYRNSMQSLTVGDMRDLLEKMMDNGPYLVTLLHIMVITKDAQALLYHHDRLLSEMMWELAQSEAERE